MKALACLFASTAMLALGQQPPVPMPAAPVAPDAPTATALFHVPERTAAQKHPRAVSATIGQICLGIAYAKAHGGSVDDYARFCGDQVAPRWNKAAGFAGFANGVLYNIELLRRDGDPPIEILAQSDSMIRFKGPAFWLELFNNGPFQGVTAAEFQHHMTVLTEQIATALGCTARIEWQDNFATFTLGRRAPTST